MCCNIRKKGVRNRLKTNIPTAHQRNSLEGIGEEECI